MAYFVTQSVQGPEWVDARPMREQALWTEHAAFINRLMYAGFIVLGGPIGREHPHRALLIIQAEDEAKVQATLAEDPWITTGMIRLTSVEPWKILVSNDLLDPVLAEIAKLVPAA
jgi:uncharacterized protein YciI